LRARLNVHRAPRTARQVNSPAGAAVKATFLLCPEQRTMNIRAMRYANLIIARIRHLCPLPLRNTMIGVNYLRYYHFRLNRGLDTPGFPMNNFAFVVIRVQ